LHCAISSRNVSHVTNAVRQTQKNFPTVRLADGSWLYESFSAEDNAAPGTLVVRFTPAGRVSDLALVTPAVVAALEKPDHPANVVLVAAARHQR
jgi:hypothetical protein